MDDSGNPLALGGMPSMRLARAVERDLQRRIKLALFWAVGIVVLVLTLFSWLLLTYFPK
jgi:hypothetical protein